MFNKVTITITNERRDIQTSLNEQMITEFCTPAELRLCRLNASWMEINYYFQRTVGGQCSQDERSRAKGKSALILWLLSSGKDISAYAQSVGVTDVELEIDLILARASMFTAPDDISKMAIGPPHRSSLGIGWRRGSHRCRVPEILSSHARGMQG